MFDSQDSTRPYPLQGDDMVLVPRHLGYIIIYRTDRQECAQYVNHTTHSVVASIFLYI